MEIKKDENGEVIEPTVEELKAELAEVQEERENYKKGLLEREAKLKELKDSERIPIEKDEEDEPEWDEASKKFQAETILKTQKSTEEIVTKTIEAKNEKQAVADFREANPNINDEQWEQIILNYNPKNGKDSPKKIMKDLERANALRMFDAGEIIDPVKIQREDAQNKLRDLNANAGPSNNGRYEVDKNKVSEGQISIASRMRVSEDALKKEDDTLSAEISLT
jgi:hypothetical protein